MWVFCSWWGRISSFLWSCLTAEFPALTLSLPHSQISEASPSCELTRWSEMGGSDPKRPLTHSPCPSLPALPLKVAPTCNSQWLRIGLGPNHDLKRVWGGDPYLLMEKGNLSACCTGGSFSLNRTIKTQTVNVTALSSCAHTRIHTQHNQKSMSAQPRWGNRKKRLPGMVWSEENAHYLPKSEEPASTAKAQQTWLSSHCAIRSTDKETGQRECPDIWGLLLSAPPTADFLQIITSDS